MVINPRFKSGSNVNTLIVIARTSVVCLRFRRLMHAIYARFMHTRGKSTIVRRTFVFTVRGIPFTQSRISPPNICADAAVIGVMHPSENTRVHQYIGYPVQQQFSATVVNGSRAELGNLTF